MSINDETVIVIEDSDSETSDIEIIETNNKGEKDALEYTNVKMNHRTSETNETIQIDKIFSLQPATGLQWSTPTPFYRAAYMSMKDKMEALKRELECPVCLDLIRDLPVPSCRNGHLVCLNCWPKTHLCPQCRVSLHQTERCYSQIAGKLLQNLELPCLYENYGCQAVLSFDEMKSHQEKCSFKNTNTLETEETEAQCSECPTAGRRSLLTTRRLHCDDCNKDYARGYFRRHVCIGNLRWRQRHRNET